MTAAVQRPISRKRVARSLSGASVASSRAGKANRSAVPAQPESFRRKLEKATAQALEDTNVGLVVLIDLSFAPTPVMLGSTALNVVTVTSVNIATEWCFDAKYLALTAGLLWAVLFLAPSRALSWWFNGPKTSFSLKRIRPVVDALGN